MSNPVVNYCVLYYTYLPIVRSCHRVKGWVQLGKCWRVNAKSTCTDRQRSNVHSHLGLFTAGNPAADGETMQAAHEATCSSMDAHTPLVLVL